MFDIAGDGFRISFRLLGLAVIVEVIGPEALQHHMWSSSVVPAFELSTEERQVVRTLDDRNALKPLVLERLDNSFGYGEEGEGYLPSV